MSRSGVHGGRAMGGPGAMMGGKPSKAKDVKGTLKRLLVYMNGKIGLLSIVFALCLVTTIVTIIGTRLNGLTIDEFIEKGDMIGLANICIVLILIYLISIFATYVQNRIMVGVSQKVSATIRKDLFYSLGKLPIKYFDTHSSGDLMSRLTNDVDNINQILSQSVTQLFSGIIMIIGMTIAMVMLDYRLTLVVFIIVPLTVLISKFIAKRTQVFFKSQQKELGNLNGYIEEMISGQKAIVLFSREEKVKKEFNEINKRLTKSSIYAQGLSGFMGPLNNLLNNLSYLIVAVLGSFLILKGNYGLTVGTVFSFILYMRQFTRPINEIMNLFNTIQSAMAGAERVFEVMDERREQDIPEARVAENLQGKVELNDVTFSYVEGKAVLKNASFEAKKGETVAIVGPTGAGKTTIVNLLTKFYDIDSGEILIDDVNINSYTRESLRKSVAMVLQDTYLFTETVLENIRHGRPEATDEEVIEAAKMAHAHHFIKQLPQGYKTILSDNGGNLSQGQRQLLAIARAILSKSQILILDEATSSIDTRTEVEIQKAMLNLMKGKTSFVIAHRLNTIKNADKILVVNNGEIVERGNHDALIAQNGFYANLYNSQFKTGMSL